MLQEKPELRSLSQCDQKLIECIRVDGANDEGPAQLEVQYWWTERHFWQGYIVTLVTTPSSGSSYMCFNHAESQNGFLTRAHSSAHTGNIGRDTNLSTAVDKYIERCDGAPCGQTNIYLS